MLAGGEEVISKDILLPGYSKGISSYQKNKLKQAEGEQLGRLSQTSLRSVGCVHTRESRRANRWKPIVKAAKMDFCGVISLLGIKPDKKTVFNYIRQRPLARKHIGPRDDCGVMGALRDDRTIKVKADKIPVLVFAGEKPQETSHTTPFSSWR